MVRAGIGHHGNLPTDRARLGRFRQQFKMTRGPRNLFPDIVLLTITLLDRAIRTANDSETGL